MANIDQCFETRLIDKVKARLKPTAPFTEEELGRSWWTFLSTQSNLERMSAV
jgi:hypothetical protein